ncbi:MAG: hypothetical protein KA521_06860 [Crocinitomicaceae bacterium]|nr:hypothetical protein [Crocinitomicaceae bacterium]
MNIEKINAYIGHSSGVYSLDIDDNFIYSGSADCFVTRWDIKSDRQDKFAIKFEFPVYAIKLINRQKFLVVGLASGDLHIFDLVARQELKFFQQHKEAIFHIQYNAQLAQFYVADAVGNFSVWDALTFELLSYFPFDCGKIRRIAIDKAGEKIALACQDGTIRVLDAITLNEIHKIEAHKDGVGSVVFSPKDSNVLYSGGKDAYLKIWNLQEKHNKLAIPAHNYMIYELQFVGDHLVSASRDKTIKCWESIDLTMLKRIDFKVKGHRHSVNALLPISSDSFVSCSDDRQLISWQIKV